MTKKELETKVRALEAKLSDQKGGLAQRLEQAQRRLASQHMTSMVAEENLQASRHIESQIEGEIEAIRDSLKEAGAIRDQIQEGEA